MTRASWMSDERIQNKAFGQIVVPGTHDSAAYSLTYDLSQVKFDNIAFLWNMDKGKAPNLDFKNRFYVGPQLYDFIFNIAMSVAKAGDQSILDQLNGGIRYFDLRIYWDSECESLYLEHGLRGCSLEKVLNEVGTFIHSAGKELVILDFSQIRNSRGQEDIQYLTSLIKQCIGEQYIYKPSSLEQLYNTKLHEITNNGSKVIILGNENDQYPPDGPVYNKNVYDTSHRNADGVDSVTALADLEQKGLENKGSALFYHISWSLTAQMENIASEVISRLKGNPPQLILENLANTANAALENFIDKNKEYSFQLITVDWYGTSPVVDLAIDLSKR